MKKIYLLIVVLFLSLGLKAQVVKTIENVAGKLDSLLTEEELNTITDLTITGTMDARDFRVLREEMPVLKQINMNNASILAYVQTWDTGESIVYAANAIPNSGFQFCDSLTSVVLPSSVTVLGASAFWECYALTSVSIPPSLISIGDGAFSECTSLSSIILPSSVTSIGSYAFYECSKLTNIEIPAGITVIGMGTFENCNSLTKITIPSTVDSIGEFAFSRCSALTDIDIPPSITRIEYCTFIGCISLRSVTLPPGVTTIERYAFSGCSAMTSINIPPAVTFIGSNAFSGCAALTSITIPSLTTIDSYVFQGCQSLASINIPSTVTTVGDHAFSYCNALTSVILPSSVTSVGRSAFEGCENLSTVVIPSSINYIGPSAFNMCNKLTAIYSKRSVPVPIEEGHFSLFDKSKCTLYVPYGSEASYAASPEWKDFSIVADTTGFSISVSSIKFDVNGGKFQFDIKATLAWTVISDEPWLTVNPASGTANGTITVTAAANTTSSYRFANITFTSEEGEKQFVRVTQKSSPVVIPLTAGDLDKLLDKEEIDTITSLTLTGTLNAKDILTIGSLAALTTLDISQARIVGTSIDNVYYSDDCIGGPSISKNSMGICGGFGSPILRTIKLPSTVSVFSCGAFYGGGYTSFTIPPSVTTIGWEAFTGCTALESITVPSTVTYMDQWVFSFCMGLKEIIFEDGIDYIPRGTCAGCTSLASLTLPASMKGIERDAFWQSPALATIYSYNPIPPYGEYLFINTDKSTCIVYVPLGSGAAYAEAEGWKDFTHIVELLPGFNISTNSVAVKASQGSTAKVTITANIAWTASSDQSWLTISPSSGSSTQQITFTADANTSTSGRMATVTIAATGYGTKTITVIQETTGKILHLTAGTLNSVLTAEELKGLTDLTLSGTIDARDFITMRDHMPMLTTLDLRETTITAWSNKEFYAANSIPTNAFSKKSSLTSLLLPLTVSVINGQAFTSCTGLTTIKIPSTVSVIGGGAFNECKNLDTIYCYAIVPPELVDYNEVFFNINKTTCTLYIPHGSKETYAKDSQWEAFTNRIEKLPVLSPSVTTVSVKAAQGSKAIATITSDAAWTANSDQPWLQVNPSSGLMTQRFTFTADANPSDYGRMAVVTVSASDYATQTITVIQEGLPKSVQLTAGTLSKMLTAEDLNGITHLTITGEMDIHDFKILNDKLPLLTFLDLSGATIAAYSDPLIGEYGSANSVPSNAFFNPSTHMGKTSLTSLLLPRSTQTIEWYAFSHCTGLTSIKIPSSVTSFGSGIWNYCVNLDTIYSYAYPPASDNISSVFNHVKPTFKVYVPYGFKQYYSIAADWKDLNNIVEMPGFELSEKTATVQANMGSTAVVELTGSAAWSASSDKSWLTVSPASGTGSQVLTFTAEANMKDTSRVATVTFCAPGTDDQTIGISQAGLITEVAETDQMRPLMSLYPNPFTDHINIEIDNPGQQQMTVDIYNLKGQRIKNLTIDNKAQKITLTWNAKDEKGQKQTPGVYLLKANEQTRKVVKR